MAAVKQYDYHTEITEKLESGEYVLLDSPMFARHARSRVWLVFVKIQDNNGELVPNYVFCKSCRKVISHANKTTTNLIRHRCFKEFMKTNQPVSIVEEEKPKINEIGSGYTQITKDHVTHSITKWLIKECQPFDLLQSEGLQTIFKELLVLGSKFGDNILNAANLLPNLSDSKKCLSEMHQECFERVYAEIGLIEENGLGLTSDIWTDCFTKQNYMALTAHYVQSGVLKYRLLGLGAFENEQNTSQVVLSKIKQILEEFNCKLSSKSLIVTDFTIASPDTSQDIQNLPCLSQLLSNAILKSVEEVPEVKEIVNACSTLVNFLIKMEEESFLEDILTNFYCHPWLKTYKILCTIEEKWNDIEEALLNLNEKTILSTINITRLRAIVKTMQPFEEAIETLEDDSSPTLHLVIVYLHELKKSCDTGETEFEDLELIEELKKKLSFYLQKVMMEDIQVLHKIAHFLYPPTNQLLQFNDTEKKIIENECLRLMENYKADNEPLEKANLEPGSKPGPAKKRKTLFSDFIASSSNQKSPANDFRRELELYKLFSADYSEDFDVLNWWQLHKDNFHCLYKLSCAVLATPSSCAASKRILFTFNNLLTKKFSQIEKGMEFQKIFFLNANAEDELDFASLD